MKNYNRLLEYFQQLDFDLTIKKTTAENNNFDCTIMINDQPIYVQMKNEIRPATLAAMHQLVPHDPTILVAANYITPNAKALLKTQKINYIDSFGNAYLDFDQLKIYVEKGNAKPITNSSNAIFTPAGAKLLFELLQKPDSVNTTYRALAEQCGIALGSVSKIMTALGNEGFLVKLNNKNAQLIKKEELLERWIPLINEKVLPNYKLDTFQFAKTKQSDWESTDETIQWAGEPAAAYLTNYLNPEQFSLFTNLAKTEIITKTGFLPNKNGNITIYKPFWKSDTNAIKTVPPLLIYAQLMYEGSPRNIETAKLVYNEFLQPNL
ncbi:type IV toxin-antitoxin system AbiEi family antitoxin [Flavobacterium sp.]|uniref:type IV toxin-antitoxin system AbiEi family antitoxin n=1 Tax=Flavobacterium sp. TaxID=239 RepID=UPI0026363C2A|nr:type IV toxin-antitoxin system AbiEi family antitoxin [Flavobacterium sp.]MDG2432322.1 type IV toxin-antitoxin system AbiEi family antitoxin [Flavobacterium sp.]